ncbi:MAG: hypothetical protein E6I88_05495 [Chloroflexi bacterium]|nr:MAG: hypothetical protein E6I88_05495 [Chloroflexota bacterium]TME47456.1 MAG: hypothetical protein E6I56_04230 [Chloroflexota bacterium]
MSLLLDQSGLALVAGGLALGLGLASGGPPWLTLGERLVIGMVVSVMALTVAGYLLALATGATAGLVLLVALAALGCGVLLLVRHRARIHRELLYMRQEFAPGDLALPAVVVLVAAAMAYLFGRAVEVTPDAWLAQYNNTWSDWALHASYATAFTYGNNLPPQNPLFSGTPLRYPFAPDFASSLLIGGGWSIPAALIWPGWAMTTLALTGLILWARRLTDGIGAGVIAVTLTLLGGGLGFWFFFGDAAHLGLVNALLHIPRAYDRFDPPVNIQWYNPILSYYLPQRSFVFGAAIVIAILLLLTPPLLRTPFFDWPATLSALKLGWRRPLISSEAAAFLVAGGLAGVLPLFHVHSLVVVGLVTACWAVCYPRPAWIGFFAAMLVLAVPRLLMAVPGDPGLPPEHQYPRWLIGWMSGSDLPAWFWIKNTGLFWPLLLLALLSPLALNRRARALIAPFSLVFLVANLVKFQPWDWDNSKLLVFWYMASAVAVGALMLRIWRMAAAGGILAGAAWVTLIASGALSLLQVLPPQGPSFVWFSAEEVRLAAEVRQATPPRAVFVTGEEPTNPIADLAGRSVLISYPGWLWSSGINYAQREADLARIYNGGPAALALLSHYHVRYLVVGPSERATLHPNVDYFSATFRLVLQSANYQIYQVPD